MTLVREELALFLSQHSARRRMISTRRIIRASDRASWMEVFQGGVAEQYG